MPMSQYYTGIKRTWKLQNTADPDCPNLTEHLGENHRINMLFLYIEKKTANTTAEARKEPTLDNYSTTCVVLCIPLEKRNILCIGWGDKF